MAAAPESLYQRKTQQLAQLKNVWQEEGWDSHVRELQDYFLPRRGRWLEDAKKKGGKRNQLLVDPTPRFAARTLGAGMHAGSTNPATPWVALETPDPEMMELPAVSQWLYAVVAIMRDIWARSNLYAVLPGLYTEAGVFGTSAMLMLDDPVTVVHFVPKTIGSYYLATNDKGQVDTMACEYQMTLANAAAYFGEEKLSPQALSIYKTGQTSALIKVLHVVEPSDGREYGNYSNQHMAWRSCYIELGCGDRPPLKESGFEDNPIAAFLWEKTELTDAYGSSPGMDVLGLSKSVQVQIKRKAQAIDKLVDPPMVGDPALKNQPSTLLPGDVTWSGFTPNGSAPKFQPAYVIKPEIQALLEDIHDSRDLIETGMYTDLFLAITRADPRNATVPEIDARKEEQILALGGVLQNQTDGLIKPLVERTFNCGLRQGRFPPPPPELQGIALKVELVGALAQAFKAIAGNKIQSFIGFVGMMGKAQADAGAEPTILDKIDWDQAADEYALSTGVPPNIVRSDDAVEKIRDDRAKAQQAQQMAATAQPIKDASIAAKNLSETDVGGGQNALQAMAG